MYIQNYIHLHSYNIIHITSKLNTEFICQIYIFIYIYKYTLYLIEFYHAFPIIKIFIFALFRIHSIPPHAALPLCCE